MVVTLGAQGVVIATSEGVTPQSAKPETTVSAHGAEGESLVDAFDFAQTAAAFLPPQKSMRGTRVLAPV